MLVTFVKSVILEIVFKDEQLFKKPDLISVIFEIKQTNQQTKTVILKIVLNDEQSNKKPSFISVIFEKGSKSTNSKEVHHERKYSPILVTFRRYEKSTEIREACCFRKSSPIAVQQLPLVNERYLTDEGKPSNLSVRYSTDAGNIC
eukprot:TRINITY_DN1115_c0_g2_i8.p1 TRINITY_DN1115_c0_g2~~TRINITY_DN1115_c0_g2_i8.p1  ORF type:complete len:146 (-),score=25.15 TRINITY_DN1115_c0_g2_i8:84-521(-)